MKNYAKNWDSTMQAYGAVFMEIFQVGMVEHTNNHNSREADIEERRLEFSLYCTYTKIFFQI